MGWVLLEIIIPLLLAVLIGLFLGWLLWSWRRTKETFSEWETESETRVSPSTEATGIVGLAGIAGLAVGSSGKPDAETVTAHFAELSEELVASEARVEALKTELDAAQSTRSELDLRHAQAATLAAQQAEAAAAEEERPALHPEREIAPVAPLGLATVPVATVTLAKGAELHPYGAGSHGQLADKREQPAGHPIKGNIKPDTNLYHRPDSYSYEATIAEVWFETPVHAESAGFLLSASHPAETETSSDTTIDLTDGNTASASKPANTSGSPTKNMLAEGAERHPYGPGSHGRLLNKREQPAGHPIKGNVKADTNLYHRPDSRNYGATVAEVWFETPEKAEAAGFILSPTHPEGN